MALFCGQFAGMQIEAHQARDGLLRRPQKRAINQESSGKDGRHFLGYFFFAVEKEVPCPQAQKLNKKIEAKRAKTTRIKPRHHSPQTG